MEQWKTTFILPINFGKVVKIIKWGKIVFSINVSGKTVCPFEKKTSSTHTSHNTKANFKCYIDQKQGNKKAKTPKPLKENKE